MSDRVAVAAGRSARSAHSNGADTLGTKSRKGGSKSFDPAVPEHKIKFEEFHNQVSHSIARLAGFDAGTRRVDL